MAYPGIAFVAMIGVGLGFALWYFLADSPQAQGPHGSGPPPPRGETAPNNTWDAPNDTRSRRRRRNTGGPKEDCSICSETLERDTTTVACGHEFHIRCITKWREVALNMGGHNTCPLCRRRI
ncbi:probable E3 ubiquitin-protein ligase ATL44 [Diprion similis]|uniref:probable E3 ubiquitin-protein ligase ATL44 n=1 Tax=Diprion similis TaxID=362088 RepID=UPI001EF99F85|nr:probable E3 ubiquitin-protein ligase ATL44 [Diprion similis]